MKSCDLFLENLADLDYVGEKKVIIFLRFSTKFSAPEFS